MTSPAVECVGIEAERAELQAVLASRLFQRSPTLTHLLSYLCEKKFAGEADRIKEYTVALDVFGRHDSFDQDTDSIVRVQANRLRKRLAEYYAEEGASHRLHLTIPIGQYIPVFEEKPRAVDAVEGASNATAAVQAATVRPQWLWIPAVALLFLIAGLVYWQRDRLRPSHSPAQAERVPQSAPVVGLPVGDEIRILAGASRSYVDRSGKLWNPDAYFSGGTAVRTTVQHIWRTQDTSIYRNSRQGEFGYDIPLKPGIYELHLYFAETFYGPEDVGGGGEGSRVMNISVNDAPLLNEFDVLADAGAGRTADMKIFTDIAPASDGKLHLKFSSVKGGRGMLSAIEIVPGTRGRIRPVRIVARDVPYYSNDSVWWSSDNYFKGGQLSASEEPAAATDDPELYETSRWGHFSYAVPVAPGRYTLTLHFIERQLERSSRQQLERVSPGGNSQRSHSFEVFCNGKTILNDLDVLGEAGDNHPLLKKISSLEPNSQGKLLLEFVPGTGYATVTAIEVVPQ